MADRLARYDGFSDKEIYEVACDVYPELRDGFDKMAQMQAFMGYSDEELLRAFRKVWPDRTRALWDEDNEFRGRLLLRAVHYLADGLRARRDVAESN